MRRLRSVSAFALALFASSGFGPASVTAAGQQAPPAPLGTAKTLNCAFTMYAAPIWRQMTPEPIVKPQEFVFQIDRIDAKKKTARIVADGAASLVALVLTATGINVIEQTPIGNLTVTTVFAGGAEGGKFVAVHSRHLGDPTALPAISQNYGTCSVG